MEIVDLIIIGAGWSGLAVAKTYSEAHPTANVLLLESADTLGGVWARHRLYPGLRSNNLLGTYEFSDFPMDEATFADLGIRNSDVGGKPIPGIVVHEYLEKYTEKFDIKRKIRFQTRVESVEKSRDGGWILSVQSVGQDPSEPKRLLAEKLVLATGLCSEPAMPAQFNGASSFEAPIFHSKDFAQHADTLKATSRVAVFGSGKTACDAVYTYATAGISVNWIIRESGHGPAWLVPTHVTPLKRWLEKLLFTRILTWMSPCIWGDADGFGWIRRFLQGTAIGRALANDFWNVLKSDMVSLNGYDKHQETAKLKPWYDPLWSGCNLGIANYPTDFFELVRGGNVKVHIADITHLSPKTVHLSNGESLPVEVLFCATGWRPKPSIKFLPEGLEEKLGLPHQPDQPDSLTKEADAEIFSRLPRLKNQPVLNRLLKPLPEDSKTPTEELSPYLLYRFIVPPAFIQDRSIGFAGMAMTPLHAICVQTQALWLTAYLDGNLPINKTEAEIKWETALHTRFVKWRYPGGHGPYFPDFVFDSLPYFDLLLGDLGLKIWRKSGWLKELTEGYGPEDYRGLVKEWVEMRESQENADDSHLKKE